MIQAPVGAVEVKMDETPVRIQLAHLEQGVIGEDVGHVKAALRHVMGPAAEFELIEFIDARQPPIITVENGVFQLGRAVIGAEIEAKALFRKIRESAAKLLDSTVL